MTIPHTAQAGPSRSVPRLFPADYTGVVLSPAEESDAALFLSTLDSFVSPRYYPPAQIIRLALHLATAIDGPTRPLRGVAPTVTTTQLSAQACRVLEKLVALHSDKLASFLPCVGGDASWAALGSLEKATVRRLTPCTRSGIWEILYAPRRTNAAARDHDAGDDDADGRDGDMRASGTVTDEGWAVLSVLVDAWDSAPPATFAAQLVRLDKRLAYDNAAAPLEVVAQAYGVGTTPTRRRSGARLVALLVRLARTSPPLFHPHALVVSLLALLRQLASPARALLLNMFASLPDPDSPDTPSTSANDAVTPARPAWTIAAYIYAQLVEDAAGVRETKTQERRRRGYGEFEAGQWSCPRVPYALKLLALPVQAGSRGTDEGDAAGILGPAKVGLLQLMLEHRGDQNWSEARDEGYLASLPGKEGPMLRVILQQLCCRVT
ncbi:hypothetical protein Q5752_003834 [Cryptotrichosporon argae]